MKLTLQRVTLLPDSPTYGVLLSQNIPLCLILERPWNDNKPLSCIPEGVYQCVKHNSPKHPNTWEITNVPDRTEILIHEGNTIADTEGCLISGTSFMTGGVSESRMALDRLRKILPSNFELEIVNPKGEV